MSKQITVRIPEQLVDFVDGLVTSGAVASRAEAVARALTREQRRQVALADVAILEEQGMDPDLDALVRYTSAHLLAVED
jgi:Arc/MetJ-type ribon-helix-helix transcriptional regulator